MTDMEQAWQVAELRWRSNTLSAFVAACSRDEERARQARELAQQALECNPDDIEAIQEIQEIVWTLADSAEDLADHPHYPSEPRPDETDRLVRDHLKDILRNHLPTEARDWMSGTQLFLDVDFHALRQLPALDSRVREDVFYTYGRATMALDLGNRQAAERELERLRELSKSHSKGTP
ncbi:hypothetical protein [Streptomyces sp. Je 1-332]|uniref:hypothetical protein n=1 Tax=Streptomyces sp. Je 1-332 TaxID=3231270 RepID=UPI00345A4AA8